MKIISFIVLFLVSLSFGQGWNTAVTTTLTSHSMAYSSNYANKDGIHLLTIGDGLDNPVQNIRYTLLNTAGSVVRTYSFEAGGSFPCIAGDNNNVFVMYWKNQTIRAWESTDAGSTWSDAAVDDITISDPLCSGISSVKDNWGLHIAYSTRPNSGVGWQTYYRIKIDGHSDWENLKNVTDYTVNEVGGFPSITTSGNRVHVFYNTGTGPDVIDNVGNSKTRDYNFSTQLWEAPQLVNSDNAMTGRVFVTGSNLQLFYYKFVNDGGSYHSDMYFTKRSIDGTNWDTPLLLQNYADANDLINCSNTANSKLNVIYWHQGLQYRNYNGSSWSNEQALTANLPVFPYCMYSAGNDLYCVWRETPTTGAIKYCQYDDVPGTPQNTNLPSISFDTQNPQISWSYNPEPDVYTGGYNIYRKIYYGSTTVAEVKLNSSLLGNISYNDNLAIPSGIPSGVDLYLCYEIEAVDAGNKVSGKTSTNSLYLGKTLSGTPSGNITLSGTYFINDNLTINPNITLYISPGTVIYNSNTLLSINGYFYAPGTSANMIKFTRMGTSGNWGTITLNGSGANGSTIQYANIQYGTEIDVISANNVTIQNCSITNSSMHGIKFYGSTGCLALNNTISNTNTAHGIYIQDGSNVSCTGNTIKKTNQNKSGVGIYFGGGGTGVAAQNDISGFSWGICAIWGSSPTSQHVNGVRNNRITNCNVGICVYNNSYPVFGLYPGDTYSLNSIYNNTTNAAVGLSYPPVSGLHACYSWWGGNPPNTAYFSVGSGSTFSYSPYATTDPWAGIPLPSISQISGGIAAGSNEISQSISVAGNTSIDVKSTDAELNNTSVTTNSPGILDSLITGINLRTLNKNTDAKEFFVSYLKKHPDNQAAYVFLYSTADSNTTPEIINYFSSLPSQASKEQKLLLSYLYLRQNNIESAKVVNNDIISTNPNTPLAVQAMLNNFYIALYNEKDLTNASAILSKIESQSGLSTQMEISSAEDALQVQGIIVSSQSGSTLQKQTANKEEIVPESYALSNNYPNPFNPTTIIEYQLPKDGFVSLKVYDVLGREVKTLVNGFKTQGKYTASFDATNLASGIYFYQFKSNGFSSIKKMILTK